MASSREKCLGLKHLSALVAALAIDLENPASAPRKSPGARGADPRRRQHRPSIVCWWRSRLVQQAVARDLLDCAFTPLERQRVEGQGEMLLPISGKKGKDAVAKPADRARARRKKAG